MQFKNISHDTQPVYRLSEKEEVVFFMLNRTGEVSFELAGRYAKAHILSLSLENNGRHTLKASVYHLAPDTTSVFIGKTIVGGNAEVKFDGLVVIEKSAIGADASQDCRNLLLSNESRAESRPALEIKTDAVRARHAATTSTLPDNTLFFLMSRGLSSVAARSLLIRGFVESLLGKIPDTFVREKRVIHDAIEEHIQMISR